MGKIQNLYKKYVCVVKRWMTGGLRTERSRGWEFLLFPFNRIRGWRQNEWKLYPKKQCETRPSGIWEINRLIWVEWQSCRVLRTVTISIWCKHLFMCFALIWLNTCTLMYEFMLADFFVLMSFLGARSEMGLQEHGVELLFVCCRCLHLQNAGACLSMCSYKWICNIFPLVSVEVCPSYHFNFSMSQLPHLWSRIIKLTLKKGC